MASYIETSSSPNVGGAIIAGVLGAAGGAIGGLVSLPDYGVTAVAVITYVSGLATATLSMVGTTLADLSYKNTKRSAGGPR